MDVATMATALGCSHAVAQRYHTAWNACLVQAGCTTVNRSAMMHAQLGHESSGLRFMREIWGPTAAQRRYEGRRDLGNIHPGDGKRFSGHGPIQITGRHNHTLVSRWAHEKGYVPTPTYFVDHPDELAGDRYGFLGAVWYWTVARPQINGLCDQGAVTAVTKLINGGTNGLADRLARWSRCLGLGNRILPDTRAVAAARPVAAAQPEPSRRRSRRTPKVLYFKSPEPKPGTPKKDWPTILVPYAFDIINGWGGRCILKVDWFGRGGWLKSGQWWVRDPNWSANRPLHFPMEHSVGAGGSERFVGYGWETAPPLRADSIQITTSCPDGLTVQVVYEK